MFKSSARKRFIFYLILPEPSTRNAGENRFL